MNIGPNGSRVEPHGPLWTGSNNLVIHRVFDVSYELAQCGYWFEGIPTTG